MDKDTNELHEAIEHLEELQERLRKIAQEADEALAGFGIIETRADAYWLGQLRNLVGGEDSNPYDTTLETTLGELREELEGARQREKGDKSLGDEEWSKQYPDTAEGAVEFYTATHTVDSKPRKVIADPAVAGVWALLGVHADPECPDAVVYLRGYDDEWGRTRPENDAEQACVHDETPTRNGRVQV